MCHFGISSGLPKLSVDSADETSGVAGSQQLLGLGQGF